MALLFMDSFDHYATADILEKWAGGSASIGATGRRSTNGVRTAGTTGILTSNVLPVSGSVAIVGVAIKIESAGASKTDTGLLQILTGSTAQITLEVDASGFLSVTRGSAAGTTLGTSSTAVVSAGAFYYIELKVTLHASAGEAIVRVNGVEVLNLTGVNTAASGTAWNKVILGGMAAVGNDTDFDDLYILDGSGAAPCNDLLGDSRVDPCYPSGAGATTGWTPSTGVNWQCVDETAPNDDSDYVSAASSGLKDTYALQDAPVAGGTIYGVQLLWSIKKIDAGVCSVAPIVRHGTTDYTGTVQNPGTAYTYQSQVYGTNPGTSAAWTETDFNAAEFGLSRTA